jgi:hypothetical protein
MGTQALGRDPLEVLVSVELTQSWTRTKKSQVALEKSRVEALTFPVTVAV